MPTVKALQYHTYDGKAYQAGETYEAADEYLDTLTVLKFAELAVATPAVPILKPAKAAEPAEAAEPTKPRTHK